MGESEVVLIGDATKVAFNVENIFLTFTETWRIWKTRLSA